MSKIIPFPARPATPAPDGAPGCVVLDDEGGLWLLNLWVPPEVATRVAELVAGCAGGKAGRA